MINFGAFFIVLLKISKIIFQQNFANKYICQPHHPVPGK